MLNRLLIVIVFVSALPIMGEAFGNNAINIPKIGAAFFDDPISLNSRPWGIGHQWTFGTSYMQALNYRWWWLVDTNFAIGRLNLREQNSFISAFMGGAGVRYNIFQDEFRPHTGLMLHYVHLMGDAAKHLPLNLGWPIFVGLKPYLGLEWLVGSEIALLLEAAYGLYVNINEPFRQILYANACIAIYF